MNQQARFKESSMKKIGIVLALLWLAVCFSGCNTAEGLGRDVERVAKKSRKRLNFFV
jgi:predicted small secreted protein